MVIISGVQARIWEEDVTEALYLPHYPRENCEKSHQDNQLHG